MNQLRALLSRERILVVLGAALAAAATLAFADLALDLARKKVFTIDEFQYAHASWAVAQGQVPYRDFFEPHFPLVYQSLSLLWGLMDDDPRNIVHLREGVLVYLLLGLVAACVLVARRSPAFALLGPVFLLACKPFMIYATEIRHDPVAFALYAAAIATLAVKRLPVRIRAATSGAFLALACWATQKAFFFGFVFFAALLADLLVNRPKKRPCMLAHPGFFLVGSGAVVAPIALYLTLTSSWDDWWRWTIDWAAEYQLRYNPFSWMPGFDHLVWNHWWMFPLAAVGAWTIAKEQARAAPEDASSADQLLLASLFTTFIAVSVQQAPWSYSLVPFVGVLAILAARGAVDLVLAVREDAGLSKVWVGLAVGLALLVLHHRAYKQLENLVEKRNNEYQLEVLGKLDELTGPADVAYDNSGSYVSRPHAYFFFETFADMRTHDADMLAREVPKALEESGAVIVFEDARGGNALPPAVRRHIDANFQHYSGEIRLWGRKLSARDRSVDVPKDGRYFLHPAAALEKGAVQVDGAPVSDPVLTLKKGRHALSVDAAVGEVYLLWMPKSGERWTPKPGAKAKFSIILL